MSPLETKVKNKREKNWQSDIHLYEFWQTTSTWRVEVSVINLSEISILNQLKQKNILHSLASKYVKWFEVGHHIKQSYMSTPASLK